MSLFFTRFQTNNSITTINQNNSTNTIYVSLLNGTFDIINLISRRFTITTNNGISKFNIEALIETSKVISDIIIKNPHVVQYNLDIDDTRNTLSKFEQLYQGKEVFFDEEDLPTCKKITEKLLITDCPDYMKPESLKQNKTAFCYPFNSNNNCVKIGGLTQFLRKEDHQTFSIITKQNEYKCNKFSVYLSDIIRTELEKDPKIEKYFYNIDDQNNEFQIICDLFNFNKIEITKNNIDILKEHAENLQIKFILQDINQYIDNSSKISHFIKDHEVIINSINQIFELLNNIKDKTVEFVTASIINSMWVETEENIQELVAFILEVAKNDISLNRYLVDLLIQLSEHSNETNYLNTLIPFIKKKLMEFAMPIDYNLEFNSNIFHSLKTPSIYALIYRLYRKNIISKSEIFKSLKDIKFDFNDIEICYWFLPVLVEMNKNNINKVLSLSREMSISNDPYYDFFKKYLPDKIDLYEKMLDDDEPDDEITKALRNDDVDTLQLIISINHINVKKMFIPFNIFDNYNFNYNPIDKIKYIDYAAYCRSIKCFKYLLLNYNNVDEKTLECAVNGGNIEIIKIVDQKIKEKNIDIYKDISHYNGFCQFPKQIYYSIIKHRNSLFDWFFEQNIDYYKHIFNEIVLESVRHGNFHPLITIISNDFDISKCFYESIQRSCENGFYNLTKFLVDLKIVIDRINNKHNLINTNFIHNMNISAAYFGNLYIFKLFCKEFSAEDFKNSMCFAIRYNYLNIIYYFFDGIQKKEFSFEDFSPFEMLNESLKNDNCNLFNYLLQQFIKNKSSFLTKIDLYMKLLCNACKIQNFEGVKCITNIVLSIKSDEDFSQAFIISSDSNQICQYFVDKKVYIDFDKLNPYITDFTKLNKEIFSYIMDNVNFSKKTSFLRCIDKAILNKNLDVIEYLFEKNAKSDNALNYAVNGHNIDVVNIVLKYNSKRYFINQVKSNGTALFNAVVNEDLPIVERLLSVPNIDPSSYNEHFEFPLIAAIKKYNLEIVNAIINFYGENIQYQEEQLNEAIKTVFTFYSSGLYERNPKILQIINRILEIQSINPNFTFTQNQSKNNHNRNRNYYNYYEEEEEEYNYNCDFHYSNNNTSNQEYDTFLFCAVSKNDIDMVKRLLKLSKIDVNKYSKKTGETPLEFAIEQNYLEIAKLLIEYPKTNINHRDFDGETALIIAVQNKLKNIVSLLINNERFDPEESKLNDAFCISNYDIAKQLISSEFLDVNYEYNFIQIRKHKKTKIQICTSAVPLEIPKVTVLNSQDSYKTLLVESTENDDINMIDLIIHHQSFDKFKSKAEDAIIISIKKNNINMFKKLLTIFDDDVNLCDSHGKSLLIHTIYESNEDIMNFILYNTKFDSNKSDILNAFVETYSYNNDKFNYRNVNKINMIKIMEKLYNYDNEHDHLIDFSKLLPNGKSFFSSFQFTFPDIQKVSSFLLEHGVNPNIQDEENFYPLEIAIKLNSLQMALSLINTNKIDYSVKIPKKESFLIQTNSSYPKVLFDTKGFTTYLHLAVKFGSSEIFKIFLERDLIDINVTDDLGNTPLMEACIYKKTNFLDYFFKKTDLDYLHVNIAGQDALSLMNKGITNGTKDLIKNKDEYLRMLRKS